MIGNSDDAPNFAKPVSEVHSGHAEANDFKHLAESLPQVVWTGQENGDIDYLSPQWSHFTGIEEEHPKYLHWKERVHADDLTNLHDTWESARSQGAVFEVELRLMDADKCYQWVSLRGVPVTDDDHEIVRWYGTATDISLQKTTEADLQEESDRKDHFLATLGHEFRNPLATIALSARMLRESDLDADQHFDAVRALNEQVDHLSRIIDDTLKLSRLTAGKLDLTMGNIELGSLIEERARYIRSEAYAKNITVESLNNEQEVVISGDRMRLIQCLDNLLHNSLKFTDSGGLIQIGIKNNAELDVVSIYVRDTGVGIDLSDVANVFEPFQQKRPGTENLDEGLGLGLTIVKNLVDLHGGTIEVSSEGRGKGSVFTINLPLLPAIAPTKKEMPEPEKEILPTKAHVFLVEDNENIAKTLRMFFEVEGHLVDHAPDGQSAFEQLETFKPDIIFCDLTLPGDYNGWDIAEKITQDFIGKDRPYLVALSGHTLDAHVQRSLAAGFDEHIAKPPALDQLRESITNAQK